MAEDKDKAKQKTEEKPKTVPDKKLKINETTQNKNIDEVTNVVNDLIAETGDDASLIDEDKSYLGLRVNATEYEEVSKHPDRIKDWAMRRGTSSIVMKENTSVAMAVGNSSKLSVDNGTINAVSNTHRIKANRIDLNFDEILFNGHKLNNRIFELADFRELQDKPGSVVGDFMVKGTVLVKSWEPNLGRYVLIRRDIIMPLFGQNTTLVEIAEGLKLKDPTKLVTDFAPFTQAMLAGDSPITEKSAKEALKNIDPKDQKLLESNIYELKVSDYKTFGEFQKALDDKKETVVKAFQASVDKGNETAKNSIVQANQVYELLMNAAIKYYSSKGDNTVPTDSKKSTDSNANGKKQS